MNTVGELICELLSFPPETPVVLHRDEEGDTLSTVSIGFMSYGKKNPVYVVLFPGEEIEFEYEEDGE